MPFLLSSRAPFRCLMHVLLEAHSYSVSDMTAVNFKQPIGECYVWKESEAVLSSYAVAIYGILIFFGQRFIKHTYTCTLNTQILTEASLRNKCHHYLATGWSRWSSSMMWCRCGLSLISRKHTCIRTPTLWSDHPAPRSYCLTSSPQGRLPYAPY